MNTVRRFIEWFKREIIETGTGIHVWRWRLISVWIVVFSILTFWNQGTERKNERNDVNKIQASREFSIRRQCDDQNERNVNTKAAYDQQIAQLPAARRARAEQGKVFTFLLIDALAPKRNCDAVVKSLTRTVKP